MLDEMNGVTSQIVNLALDVAVLRHQVIANNISNVETNGYSVKNVVFEELIRAITSDKRSSPSEKQQLQQIESIEQRLRSGELVKISENEKVQIDSEMIKLSQNVIHYQSLLQALKGHREIIRMAVSEGR